MHSSSQHLVVNSSASVALLMANPDVGLAKGKEEKANFELWGVRWGGGQWLGHKTVEQESPAALPSSFVR